MRFPGSIGLASDSSSEGAREIEQTLPANSAANLTEHFSRIEGLGGAVERHTAPPGGRRLTCRKFLLGSVPLCQDARKNAVCGKCNLAIIRFMANRLDSGSTYDANRKGVMP